VLWFEGIEVLKWSNVIRLVDIKGTEVSEAAASGYPEAQSTLLLGDYFLNVTTTADNHCARSRTLISQAPKSDWTTIVDNAGLAGRLELDRKFVGL
jgi:hypothetical protein